MFTPISGKFNTDPDARNPFVESKKQGNEQVSIRKEDIELAVFNVMMNDLKTYGRMSDCYVKEICIKALERIGVKITT
jgi:hypothetical protein